MRTLTLLLLAALAGTAARAGQPLPPLVAIESDAEFRTLTWLNHYYAEPQPELLVKRVFVLSRMGYFEQEGQAAQALGFFASIFARHPDKLAGWFREFRALPAAHRRLLASAAWLSGSRKGEAFLRGAPGVAPAALDDLLSHQPTPLAETEVLSVSSMNLQWGAFLASGDARHLRQILAAIGSKTPGIAQSARLSLALNASQHPRVLEICRAELDRQPNAVREQLRAVLDEAATARSLPTG